MTKQTERPAQRIFSVKEKARMADETTRVAMEAIDAETEAREAKTAKLRAVRLAAEHAGTHASKKQVGRRQ